MIVVKAWAQTRSETKAYLKFNDYKPLFSIGHYFFCRRIGHALNDAKLVIG